METTRTFLITLPMTVDWTLVFCAAFSQTAFGAFLLGASHGFDLPKARAVGRIAGIGNGVVGSIQLCACLMHCWGMF